MDMGLLHVLILRVPKICIDVDNPIIIGSLYSEFHRDYCLGGIK